MVYYVDNAEEAYVPGALDPFWTGGLRAQVRINRWQKAFPDRKIVPIDCRELIWGLGAFHCLTQQQPQP